MSKKIQKAIDSLTDPQTEAEWDAHDGGLMKVIQEAQKALDGVRGSLKKLNSAAGKAKKFKWGGIQVSYIESAARKLQKGVYDAEDDLERATSDLRR